MQQVRSASHVPWAPFSRVSLPEGGTLSSLSINTDERKEQGRISSWAAAEEGWGGNCLKLGTRSTQAGNSAWDQPFSKLRKPKTKQVTGEPKKREREKERWTFSRQAIFLPGESHGQSTDGLQSLGSQRVGHDLALKHQKSLGKDVWPGPGSLDLTRKDPGLEKNAHSGVGWGGRDAHEGRDGCIHMADSRYCIAETNRTL